MTSNADIVLDQFTRQAAPFANSAAMRDEDAIIDVSSYPAAEARHFPEVCATQAAGLGA